MSRRPGPRPAPSSSASGAAGSPGSALLLVVAATSSLAVVAAVLLLVAGTAYELVDARADGIQARLLVEAGLRGAERGLRDGTISVPDPDRVDPEAWRATWSPGPPPAPPGFEPLPWGGEPSSSTAGVGVELRFVVAPDGAVRAPPGSEDDLLIEATATSWFRRGRAVETVRVAVPAPPRD